MLKTILGWISGSLIGQIAKPLQEAYQARLKAQTDSERLAADMTIKRLEAAMALALAESGDRWSATRLGRLLIVVPFGLWWTAIFADSIFNFSWDVLALPPRIQDMAEVLVPAIVIADAGVFAAKSAVKSVLGR